MKIAVVCPNGHTLRAKAEHAGKKVRCPSCKAAVHALLLVAWGALFIAVITTVLILVAMEIAGPGLVLITAYVASIASMVVSVNRLVKNVEFLDKLRKVVLPQGS